MKSAAAWPDGRWHYRRSLASRVAVLTTLVLGVTIAILAATAYVVMRQQLMSSLDQSLLNRAHKATAVSALSKLTVQGVPPWMLGAADVRVIIVTPDGASGTDIPHFNLGRPEYDVVTGQRDSSVRTLITDEGEQRGQHAERTEDEQHPAELLQRAVVGDERLRQDQRLLAAGLHRGDAEPLALVGDQGPHRGVALAGDHVVLLSLIHI